jgi:hypothetical protein
MNQRQRHVITPEALELFRELESVSERRLRREPYTEKSKRLANLLGLSDAWWRMEHVHDRSRGPCHPEGYIAREDWYRCRAIREMLLEAAAQSTS